MPRSPSIVPEDADRDVYLVLDDFGRLGRAWHETDEGKTDLESLFRYLLEGHYENPVKIVAFNTAQGWSRDVTSFAADILRKACVDTAEKISPSLQKFLDAHRATH
jgi:hypothetical protein